LQFIVLQHNNNNNNNKTQQYKVCENGNMCKKITDSVKPVPKYEGWNFNSDNYLFTTDTK